MLRAATHSTLPSEKYALLEAALHELGVIALLLHLRA